MNIEYIADRRKIKYTAAFLFLAVSLAFLRKILDHDVWFHLATGKDILANLRIPQNEIFVYPLLGKNAAYHEWGFGVLLYFLYNNFGYWGMSCFNGVVAGLLTVFLYLSASSEKVLEGWTLLILAGLIPLIEFRFFYRPETLLLLFLAIEIYLLERFYATEKWKWLYPLPALCMILGWIHPSSLLLIIVLSCYIAGFLWHRVRSGNIDGKTVFAPALVLFSSVLASILNPYGLKQLLLPVLFAGETHLQLVLEFRPILETEFRNRFILLMIAGLLPLIALKSGKRITYLLLFSVFGFLALTYARNLAMLAVVIYVPIVQSLRSFTGNSPWLSRVVSHRFFSALALVLLMAAIWSVTLQGRWGAGPVSERFPVKSAAFMLENKPEGRIFNLYHMGNFLEWKLFPAYHVSIDGRHYTHDLSIELHEQVFRMKEGWEKVLRDYNVGTIVTSSTTMVAGSLVPLVLELDADPSWALAVVEPEAMLFIKTDILAGLHGVRALSKDLIWLQVIGEASRNLRYYPDAVSSYLSLGIAYFKLHEFHSARGPLRKYLEHFPDDAQSRRVVTLIESAERGDLSSMEELEVFYKSGRHKPNY